MNSQPLSSVPKMMPWKCTLPNSVADSSCEVYVEYLRAKPLIDQIPAELQADVQTLSVFSHLREFYGDVTPFVSEAEIADLEEKFPRVNEQSVAQSALAKKTLEKVEALLNNSGSEAPKGLPLAALQMLRSLLQTM